MHSNIPPCGARRSKILKDLSTSQTGMKGIVATCEIWARHQELAQDALKGRKKNLRRAIAAQSSVVSKDTNTTIPVSRTTVLFSQEKTCLDLEILSRWR